MLPHRLMLRGRRMRRRRPSSALHRFRRGRTELACRDPNFAVREAGDVVHVRSFGDGLFLGVAGEDDGDVTRRDGLHEAGCEAAGSVSRARVRDDQKAMHAVADLPLIPSEHRRIMDNSRHRNHALLGPDGVGLAGDDGLITSRGSRVDDRL